jgi:hypothetical protein
MNDEYHKDVIRSKLTRNIAVTFKEVREELVSALDDFLPTSEDSMCQSLELKKSITHKECRVGQESCFRRDSSMSVVIFQFFDVVNDTLSGRNRDYQHLNMTFAINVLKYSTIISLFPRPLKPCVVVSISVPLSPSLSRTLVSLHACYRTSLLRSNKR